MRQIDPVVQFNVQSPMRQFRLVPIHTGSQSGFVVVHSGCAEVDPYHKMFFLPPDTLKLSAFSSDGSFLWQRDLGRGMIPGIWFCPVLPFDLDGDGADEVWLVSNSDPDHALNYEAFVLEGMRAADGRVTQSTPWPRIEPRQDLSGSHRNFINAGSSGARRRLITAQGTYGPMQLQCWDASMQPVWSRRIAATDTGARGSHMFPVIDLDGDGKDELFWGERCIDIDTGLDRWVGDSPAWAGHSDVIQPTRDARTGRWSIYTCREAASPGGAVVMFDDQGSELWGRRGMGHMDMGWTARLNDDGSHVCYALEIATKSAGPGGFQRGNVTEYLFDMHGKSLPVETPLYLSLPVDFDGDGRHELTYMGGPHKGLVVDRHGQAMAQLQGEPAYGGKILDLPGEQVVTWDEDGTVRIYAWPDAHDTAEARARYQHPYYAACLRLWAMAYNRCNVAGI